MMAVETIAYSLGVLAFALLPLLVVIGGSTFLRPGRTAPSRREPARRKGPGDSKPG